MKRKLISLALALVLCLSLSLPAFAVPDSVEELLENISLVRNGAYDEESTPFASGKTVPMMSYDYETGESTTIDVEYSVFSKDDSWTLTHTGGAEYTVWLLCNTYEKNEEGLFDMGEHRAWRGDGFVDTALVANEEYGFVTELKPGESLTFSAESMRYEYYGSMTAYESGIPTAEDKGTGEYLYEIYINMDYPAEDTTTGLHTYFMIDESQTAAIKAELDKKPAQPQQPVQPAEATAAPTNFSMSAESKASFYNINNYLTAEATAMDEDPNAAPITTGAKNGLQLKDLRGLAYDDPKWDQLLDQMTLDDMNTLISLGGYQTNSVESIGKVRTNDNDGPASINNNFTGVGSVGFPSSVMIASTWNKEMAHDFGDSIGKMANEMNTSGWYAPAMNIHRTAFAGRNFEYYSEDGMLSGAIASNAVSGAKEHGVYSYMKHFALNDQEGNRLDKLCTWSNEQAIREIYLKPFEMCVKNYEGKSMAVMSAFNYIGYKYAGANPELLNTVLRDEWGFKGMVLTDYFGGYGYQDADIQIRNGGDFCLTPQMIEFSGLTDRTSGTSLQAARQACKNILYTTANSRAYANGAGGGLAGWEIAMYAISAVVILAAVAGEVMIIRGAKKKR